LEAEEQLNQRLTTPISSKALIYKALLKAHLISQWWCRQNEVVCR